MNAKKQKCPDGGTCHHLCEDNYCFRKQFCGPLSTSGLDLDWNPIDKTLRGGTKEKTSVTFTRYRDENGLPTCSLNFDKGHFCRFYRTHRFGTDEVCLFSNYEGKHISLLVRRKSKNQKDHSLNTGSLIPGTSCVMFTSNELETES